MNPNNNDYTIPETTMVEEPNYPDVAADAVGATITAGWRTGLAGLAVVGAQALWPASFTFDMPDVEITLGHIGLAMAIIAGLNGIVTAFLGINSVRFWRRHRGTAAEGGE